MSLLRYNCHLFLKCFILVFYTVESVKLITILIQTFNPQLGNKVKFLLILQLSITHILLLIICGLFLASQCLLYNAFNKKKIVFHHFIHIFPFSSLFWLGWSMFELVGCKNSVMDCLKLFFSFFFLLRHNWIICSCLW